MVDLLSGAATETWVVVWSFVALSVLVVELFQRVVDDAVPSRFGASERLQPVGGALLGLIPGCGGAIAVTSLYGRGTVRLGTVGEAAPNRGRVRMLAASGAVGCQCAST
ncbi:hypothetical protein DVK02_00845 [Halobellus sp. Atlit-31R]|nr:hypothetical protein DVK02_00845 [Halobellus sp. Atlit-31R]